MLLGYLRMPQIPSFLLRNSLKSLQVHHTRAQSAGRDFSPAISPRPSEKMTPLSVREESDFRSPSLAEPKTHLDTTPGKLWVLLLELGDELIIVHLQQTRASYGGSGCL